MYVCMYVLMYVAIWYATRDTGVRDCWTLFGRSRSAHSSHFVHSTLLSLATPVPLLPTALFCSRGSARLRAQYNSRSHSVLALADLVSLSRSSLSILSMNKRYLHLYLFR